MSGVREKFAEWFAREHPNVPLSCAVGWSAKETWNAAWQASRAAALDEAAALVLTMSEELHDGNAGASDVEEAILALKEGR